ncbi:LlaMI family restriction endonuclease [Providencia sp. PROV212]|uniref:LlaMI family restriction endonuclease n=1 Tax=Providencia sp. PROV212 TaxID=2949909 RepID=UPI00234BBC5E|nr:LlaMI family restriction endonuclease [Providencia sp. PROV212]
MSTEEAEIIRRFMDNVYGKRPNLTGFNINHDGSEGHWLEQQMGITANCHNEPDLLGFEMKNDTSGKTTFGDWSADYYLFRDRSFGISRDQFILMFGKPNPMKENRYSWSGTPIPTVRRRSEYNGSYMDIDPQGNIFIYYEYSSDPRHNKNNIIPQCLRDSRITLAKWERNNLEGKLSRKFGGNGWFKCYKDENGIYSSIAFGEPMIFDNWLNLIREGVVFFDSGMYQGNPRNYSQWRANNRYWEKLIVRRYPKL